MTIRLRATPRASRDIVEGPGPDGALRVRVTAPPADGAANRAVIKLLARELGVPASRLTIVSGAGARDKRVALAGLDAATLRARWPGLLASD